MGKNRTCIAQFVYMGDAFLKLSVTQRLLYTYLQFESDGYGIVTGVYTPKMQASASDEDLRTLIDNGYLLPIEDVYVIRHWWRNNTGDAAKNLGSPSRTDITEKVFRDTNSLYESIELLESKKHQLELSGHSVEIQRKFSGHIITLHSTSSQDIKSTSSQGIKDIQKDRAEEEPPKHYTCPRCNKPTAYITGNQWDCVSCQNFGDASEIHSL